MTISACDVPGQSVLDPAVVERAWFPFERLDQFAMVHCDIPERHAFCGLLRIPLVVRGAFTGDFSSYCPTVSLFSHRDDQPAPVMFRGAQREGVSKSSIKRRLAFQKAAIRGSFVDLSACSRATMTFVAFVANSGEHL